MTPITSNNRELKLERIVDVSRELIWKCWTEPEHLMPWFCPKPWQTTACKIDLQPGGEFFTIMRSPEGADFPNHGVYLEIVPNERLVWTDAYTAGWYPILNSSDRPFIFTGYLEFTDAGEGKTMFTAFARHWTDEDCKKHEEMGFHEGWGIALDQLIEYSKTIK